MKTFIGRTLSSLVLIALSFQTSAAIIAYDFEFEFELNNTSYLSGSFEAEDVNLDDFIRDDELISLSFTNGSQSLIDHAFDATISDNFNFDILNNLFLLGGNSFTEAGQRWNSDGTGFGFQAGSSCAGLDNDGSFQGCDASLATLIAQTVTGTTVSVPEPTSILLLAFGLLGARLTRRS